MARMTPLLERNRQFARAYPQVALGPPAAQLLSVSGHVYDIATGRVTTAIDARRPQPTVTN